MIKKYILGFVLLFSILGLAQNPAELESTFNINNITPVSGGIAGGFDKCFPMPNGKILVHRSVSGPRFNGAVIRDIERLTADGTLDTTFNPQGTGFSGGVNDVAELPDGKVLIAGSFNTYNGVTYNGIIRFNTDGSVDTTFTTALGSGGITKISVQPDGKIVIVGNFTTYNSVIYNRILRLNSDGSVDTSFSTGTGFNASVSSMVLQNDGKLVIGGTFATYNGVTVNRIIRLNNDGSQDTSFATGTGFNNTVSAIALSQDNKLFIGGNFTAYAGTTDNRIIKLNLDGSIDNSFAIGTGFNSTVSKIVLLPDGKILTLGAFTSYNGISRFKCIKLNTDGTQSNSVLPTIPNLKDIFVRDDDKIVIVGSFYAIANTAIASAARFNSDETLDPSFAAGIAFDYRVDKTKVQPDGKILVCGAFFTYNNTPAAGLVRLNQDGTIDPTFNIGTGANYEINTIELQSDGKVLVGGNFTSFNGYDSNSLIRLNPDGTVDTTFNIGDGFNAEVTVILMQPDGKILVGGAFDRYKGVFSSQCIRLNSDGTLNANFSPFVGGKVNAIALQNDGKVVIGMFSSGNNSSATNRCLATGVNDSSFTAYIKPATEYGVLSIAIQNDGKILLGGGFTTATDNFVRLNTNGTKDTSFITGTGFTAAGQVKTIFVQPDNKIIVGGSFSKYNGTDSWCAIRLNPNGSIDTSFNMGGGFTGNVYDIAAQPDGKILFAGAMSAYNSYVIGGLVRLIGGGYYSLSGQNKLDANLNGCDSSDYPFPNLKMNFNDGLSNYDFFVNNTGDYSFLLSQGNYTITPVVNPNFSISPTSITANFPSQFTSLVQNYCLTPLNGSYADLEVQVIPLNNARPGFDANYKIVFKNKGVVTQSGEVNLTFDDQTIDLVSTVPAFTSQSSNMLSWSFTNLNPQESKSIIVSFNLNSPTETPALNSGDSLAFNAAFTNVLTDFTPSDNTFALNQRIVNSFDPNDKRCLEGETVGIEKIGDYVHYVIRFENNGTANAQFIKIEDIIDTSKFDISTLEPLNGSHAFVTKISNSNKVEFYFNTINLPFDDANNDGYVMYKIKLKPTLVNGDVFSNTANIYFDFNPAIITNTAVTTIATLSNEEHVMENSFNVYPNPVLDLLYFNKRTDIKVSSVTVYNTMGQIVLKAASLENQNYIDVSGLSSGSYLLKLETGKGLLKTRFLKL